MVRVFSRKEARRSARQRDAQRRASTRGGGDATAQLKARAAAAASAKASAAARDAAAATIKAAQAPPQQVEVEPRFIGNRGLRAYLLRRREARHNAVQAYYQRNQGLRGLWGLATGLVGRAASAIGGKGARRVSFAEGSAECMYISRISGEDRERLFWSSDERAAFKDDAAAQYGWWLRLGVPIELVFAEELKDEEERERRGDVVRADPRLYDDADFSCSTAAAVPAPASNLAEETAAAVAAGDGEAAAAAAAAAVPEAGELVAAAALLARLMAVHRGDSSVWDALLQGRGVRQLLPAADCCGDMASPAAVAAAELHIIEAQ